MSEYKLMIFADPNGPFGHFSVGLKGPYGRMKVVGKYPDENGPKLPFGDVPGEIRDDSDRIKGKKVDDVDIPLTPEQAAKVDAYIDDVNANPGKYNLKDDNCIDFAQGALDKAGSDKNVAQYFDEEVLREMGWVLSAGNEAINDDRRDRGLFPEFPPNPIDGEIGGTPGVGAADFSTKPVEQWTESDARAAHAEAVSLSPYIPSAMVLRKKVERWYEITFGNDPVELDATGRMIDQGPHKLPASNSGGAVHVSAYKRQQDGRNVSVAAHTHSRPH